MKFIDMVVGGVRSNTVQFNSIMAAVWAALIQSEWIQSNPEYVAIVAGIQSVLNILLRAKTKLPLSER